MSYHSQFGEDQWIVEHLNPPEHMSFCEVGAFDGIASSNTLHFEQAMDWVGLLIEPNSKAYEMCLSNRRGFCLNAAISNRVGMEKFYIPMNDEGRGSLEAQPSTSRITKVPVMLLRDAWPLFFGVGPYLLSIDTEGTELDVWASRGSLAPEIVIMEYLQWGSNEKKQPICAQLDKDGYKVVRCTEANLIFVKK